MGRSKINLVSVVASLNWILTINFVYGKKCVHYQYSIWVIKLFMALLKQWMDDRVMDALAEQKKKVEDFEFLFNCLSVDYLIMKRQSKNWACNIVQLSLKQDVCSREFCSQLTFQPAKINMDATISMVFGFCSAI